MIKDLVRVIKDPDQRAVVERLRNIIVITHFFNLSNQIDNFVEIIMKNKNLKSIFK